ncbi:hypothetical protein H8N01_25140, partial [Streptomyces sp. AC536]|nr:hypothetical protein [Streptomyces buecherae]
MVDLANDPGPPVEVLLGAFARRGERATYAADHALNVLWNALVAESERWRAEQRWPTPGTEPDPFAALSAYHPSASEVGGRAGSRPPPRSPDL